MDYLIKWIKNIAVFYIIASLILNIVPGEQYKKYIKLFLGIVMVILLIKPVAGLTGLDARFEKLFDEDSYGAMSADLRAELMFADEERIRMISGEFEKKISAGIREYVESLGAVYLDSRVEINTDPASESYGMLSSITVFVSRGNAYNQGNIYVPEIYLENKDKYSDDELIAIEIKNYLADFYKLEKRNIYVNISQ